LRPSLFDLSGKRALVTGSSRGIGFAIAEGLARHGAAVVLNARDAAGLESARGRLAADGYAVVSVPFDVTDHAASRQGVDEIERDIGPIDILVNNAGMQHRAPLEEFPAERWDEMLRTNVSSVFNVGQAVARHMIKRGQGKIINIGSTDWARNGLQINAIAPGYFKTVLNQALVDDAVFSAWLQGRTPAGRWGEVEELVGAAVFLAGAASSFVNGHTLYVDGGISISL